MRLRNTFLFLLAILFILCINTVSAQQGSLYFSVGYNKAWYAPSTIGVDQDGLGNSYSILNAKGDNKTNTGLSAYQFNYRIGYYCNYEQTLGMELSFDPVNYRITDGQNIHIDGTVNNTPKVKQTVFFSANNGYYYLFNGANLTLFNIVRRFEIYRSNNKKLGFDAVTKIGIGPVLPHFQNSLPIDPVNDPQLQYGGWNVGGELALRVTLYRYLYIEFAGKYDYANLKDLSVYEGTAAQKLSTYEVIGSIGFTFPTTKNNPLFWRQHVITIRPLYEKNIDSLNDRKNTSENADNFATGPMQDIPEFDEIVDKRTKEYNDSMKIIEDSLMKSEQADSVKAANSMLQEEKKDNTVMDSLMNKPATDTAIKTDNLLPPEQSKPGIQDSTLNSLLDKANSATPSKPDSTTETKKQKKQEEKERKKKEKQDKKDQRKKEKEAIEAPPEKADSTGGKGY